LPLNLLLLQQGMNQWIVLSKRISQ
jgi:hypothetical protein